jgi:hypothetical protein
MDRPQDDPGPAPGALSPRRRGRFLRPAARRWRGAGTVFPQPTARGRRIAARWAPAPPGGKHPPRGSPAGPRSSPRGGRPGAEAFRCGDPSRAWPSPHRGSSGARASPRELRIPQGRWVPRKRCTGRQGPAAPWRGGFRAMAAGGAGSSGFRGGGRTAGGSCCDPPPAEDRNRQGSGSPRSGGPVIGQAWVRPRGAGLAGEDGEALPSDACAFGA